MAWCLAATSSASATLFPDKYDAVIKEASALYLPGKDWRWQKAQLYQESRLDPLAVSPAGAQGIAQFMPGTAGDIFPLLKFDLIDVWVAESAIHANAYFMRRLRRAWVSKRPEKDRHCLALASYNAGMGNILQAQTACGGVVLCDDIMMCLPDITGHHSQETLTYLKRIDRWYLMMRAGG